MPDLCLYEFEYNTQQYKTMINSSVLFTIDSEDSPSAYQREKYKLIENVAKYMLSINNGSYYCYGEEIWELAERCIQYYDINNGISFLSYYLKAWEKELKKILFHNTQDDKLAGIHIPKNIIKKINTHVLWAKRNGIDYLTLKFAQKVSDIINWDVYEVYRLIFQMEDGIVSDTIETDDGLLNVSDYTISEWENVIESELLEIEMDGALELIKKIDNAFEKLQDRQKSMMSVLLTSMLFEILQDETTLLKDCENATFFNTEIYNLCQEKGRLSQRDIARMFLVKEQHISRCVKRFKDLLQY